MSVIHIYGASGSGTSTLGNALSAQYGYCQLDSDCYFWLPTDPPFTQKRPREERLPLMRADMAKAEKVVISGSLCEWGDPLIPLFDLAIQIVTPTAVRLSRIRAREFARFGERILAGGDMYEEHQKFLEWSAGYDDGDLSTRSRMLHDTWSRQLTCPHILLDGTRSFSEMLEQIQQVYTL